MERDKIDTPSTYIHFCITADSLSRFNTNTSIKSGGVKLIIADSSCGRLIIYVSKYDSYFIPRIDDCIDKTEQAKYVSTC